MSPAKHMIPHVIIAGAGPCGLLAALQLQQAGIKCTIVERAAENRLEADVGSGYDLSPSSAEVLQRVGLGGTLGADGVFRGNQAMWVSSTDGTVLRLASLTGEQHAGYYVASRSKLQRVLLGALRKGAEEADAGAALMCGYDVVSFDEDEEGVSVKYRQRGGTAPASTLRGDVLLGCDGVHSAVRKGLHGGGTADGMHFCNAVTWWGGTELVAGTALDAAVSSSQAKGDAFLMVTGTRACPGVIVAGITDSTAVDGGKKVTWAMTMPPEAAKGCAERVTGGGPAGEDLTRRGGVIGAEAKALAMEAVGNGGRFVQDLVAGAEESKVTLVGLYDRKDLDLAWTSEGGRVALLGDAAHPQSPMQGQGVNMALCDAHCVASRLTAAQQHGGTLPSSLRAYDNADRRRDVNKIIQKARDVTTWSVSKSPLVTRVMRFAMSSLPLGWIMAEIDSSDVANSNALQALEKDIANLRSQAI